MFGRRARTGNRCRFVLDGQHYTVRIATPALLDILTGRASFLQLVPGATDDADYLWTRMFDPDDAFDLPDAEFVCEGVISALTGWPVHASYALAGLLDAQWAIISARATAGGTDLMALPVHRVLDFAYGLWIENADEEERRKIDGLLRPPADTATRVRREVAEGASSTAAVTSDSPPPGFTVAEQRSSFFAAASAIGGARTGAT